MINRSKHQYLNQFENGKMHERKNCDKLGYVKPKKDENENDAPPLLKWHNSSVINKRNVSLDKNKNNISRIILENSDKNVEKKSPSSPFQRSGEMGREDKSRESENKLSESSTFNSILSSDALRGLEMSNPDKPTGVLDNDSRWQSNSNVSSSDLLLNVIEKQQKQLYQQQLIIEHNMGRGREKEKKKEKEVAENRETGQIEQKQQQRVEQRQDAFYGKYDSTRDSLHEALGLFDEDEIELLRDSEKMTRGRLSDKDLTWDGDPQSVDILTSSDRNSRDGNNNNNNMEKSYENDDVTNRSYMSSSNGYQSPLCVSIGKQSSGIANNKPNYFDSDDTYYNRNDYNNKKGNNNSNSNSNMINLKPDGIQDLTNKSSSTLCPPLNYTNGYEIESEKRYRVRNKNEEDTNIEKKEVVQEVEDEGSMTDDSCTESEYARNIPKRRVSPMTALLQSLLHIEERSLPEDEHALPSPSLSSQTRSQSKLLPQRPFQGLSTSTSISNRHSIAQYRPFSAPSPLDISIIHPHSNANANPNPLSISQPHSTSMLLKQPSSPTSHHFSSRSIPPFTLPLSRPPPLSLPFPVPLSPPAQNQDTNRSSPPLSSLNNTPSTVSFPPPFPSLPLRDTISSIQMSPPLLLKAFSQHQPHKEAAKAYTESSRTASQVNNGSQRTDRSKISNADNILNFRGTSNLKRTQKTIQDDDSACDESNSTGKNESTFPNKYENKNYANNRNNKDNLSSNISGDLWNNNCGSPIGNSIIMDKNSSNVKVINNDDETSHKGESKYSSSSNSDSDSDRSSESNKSFFSDDCSNVKNNGDQNTNSHKNKNIININNSKNNNIDDDYSNSNSNHGNIVTNIYGSNDKSGMRDSLENQKSDYLREYDETFINNKSGVKKSSSGDNKIYNDGSNSLNDGGNDNEKRSKNGHNYMIDCSDKNDHTVRKISATYKISQSNNSGLIINDDNVAKDISNSVVTSERILSIEHRFDSLLSILSAQPLRQSEHDSLSAVTGMDGDAAVARCMKGGERCSVQDSEQRGGNIIDFNPSEVPSDSLFLKQFDSVSSSGESVQSDLIRT